MAIQKYEYEVSIWEKELKGNNTINETKLQVIGAHDMTHLGRATNIHFRKLLNGTHVLTFQMPIRFFNSEVGDYVQNELIENLFNEQKIKLKFKNQWYEMDVKSISEKKNFKSVMKDFTCSDGFIDELSRTGYDIYLDPEANNSVNEIHNFMEETLENSIWDYKPEWNWGDFTEYKEERFYKIPLSLFGGSISAYKLTLDIPSSCLTDSDIKEIENVNSHQKRPIQYGDDLAGTQNLFWNQQGKTGSTLYKNKTTITGDYIYIPMSDLSIIEVQLYKNLNSAAQSTITYFNTSLTKYALQPTSNNPKDFIQFLYLPDNSTYTIDDGGVMTDYNHTYILSIDDFNNQNKSSSKVYYQDNDGTVQTVTSNIYSLKSFIWKPVYYTGFLETIGEKQVTKARKVNITNRTELNVYDDIYTKVYNNKISENDLKVLLPKGISSSTYGNYRITSKIDTEMILPTLARNYVLTGKTATDTTGWESYIKNNKKYEINISSLAFQDKDTYYKIISDDDIGKSDAEVDFYSLYFEVQNTNSTEKAVINFGFVGAQKSIEKEKTYALKIDGMHATSDEKYLIYNNWRTLISRLVIAEGNIDNNGNYKISTESTKRINFSKVAQNLSKETMAEDVYILFKSKYTIKNPYIYLKIIANEGAGTILKNLEIFEAYTRGQDILEEPYLELRAGEYRNTLEEQLKYKYSGRNIELPQDYYAQNGDISVINKRDLLLETDVTLGNAYEKYTYFIQEKKNLKTGAIKDTFLNKEKWFEENDTNFSNTKYVDSDFEYNTYELNLNQCNYLNNNSNNCSHSNNTNKVCYYKKYGFCPYLFTPELHPRKIRTLQQSKSNRFNIIQELSKVFEVYPTFTIPHDSLGKVSIENNKIEKYVHFMTEKGNENLIGFRYTKNLTDISRTLTSDNITTKLIISPVDSQLSKTGYCTIQSAEDNLGKNNFIFDFSYYTKKGLLDPVMVESDLYGLGETGELAYLTKIDKINHNYDLVQSRLNALTDENYKTLKATNTNNLNGITATQEELGKTNSKINQYKGDASKESTTYKSYLQERATHQARLNELIESLFFTGNKCYNIKTKKITSAYTPKTFENIFNKDWSVLFEAVENKEYKQCGTVGQEQGIQAQIDQLTKISQSYLKQGKKLTTAFNKKYEPFIKEGTWSDSNYLTDNEYYWGGVSVLSDSSKPQINYNISVIDITNADIENRENYEIDLGDITYVEDEDFFGINKQTGFANREKVLISEIDYSLDQPQGDRVNVQNYTTQFNDLFQQITASVQSLTYNENIYKRAQGFTPQHYVKVDSLQGTLNTGDLTLLKANESIKVDRNGTEGNAIQNSSSRYKLNGDGLFFSTNGGTTWIQAVSPKGLNMDYAKFGAIDAGKIKIVDKSYAYFLWDKKGIVAYDPNDDKNYVIYNKDGLSLYDNNNLKLRAGYGNNKEIGFFLYGEDNRVIFSTNSESDISARLTLSGEMYVSNNYYNGQYRLSEKVTGVSGTVYIGHEKISNNQKPKIECTSDYLMDIDNDEKLFLSSDDSKRITLDKKTEKKVSILINLGLQPDNDLWKQFPYKKGNSSEIKRDFGEYFYLKEEGKIKNKHSDLSYRCYKFNEYTFLITNTGNERIELNINDLFNKLNELKNRQAQDHDTTTVSGHTINWKKLEDAENPAKNSADFDHSFNRYFITKGNGTEQIRYGNSFQFYLATPRYTEDSSQSSYSANSILNEKCNFINANNDEDFTEMPLQTLTLYCSTSNKNEKYRQKIRTSSTTQQGSTSVYINNLNPSNTQSTTNTRLFSLAKKIDNTKSDNIFSITADGTIYIGGTISDPHTKLSNEITVEDGDTLQDIINKVKRLWSEHHPNN